MPIRARWYMGRPVMSLPSSRTLPESGLIKPTIINVGQDWGDAVGESQDRIRKIRIGS